MQLSEIFLDQDQKDLLIKIIEAQNSIPKTEQRDFTYHPSLENTGKILNRKEIENIFNKGESVILEGKQYLKMEDIPPEKFQNLLKHPGFPEGFIEVSPRDIDALEVQKLLIKRNRKSLTTYFLAPTAFEYYKEISVKESKCDSSLALVMKGGGVKGLAYVGALKELEKYYKFTWFIGTSAGAIAAVLLGAGYTSEELERILSQKKFTDFLDAEFYELPFNLLFKKGLYPAKAFTAWIDNLLAEKLDSPIRVTLERLPHRVTIYASRREKNVLVFDSKDPKTRHLPASYVVRCSMAIPFVFTPEQDAGIKVMDGGIKHNYPVEVLLKDNPDAKFIGLYLGPEHFEGEEKDKGLLSELYSIWTEAADIDALTKYVDQTVVIDPRPISSINFNLNDEQKNFLINCGKISAQKYLLKQEQSVPFSKEAVKQESAHLQQIRHNLTLKKLKRKRFWGIIVLFLCCLFIVLTVWGARLVYSAVWSVKQPSYVEVIKETPELTPSNQPLNKTINYQFKQELKEQQGIAWAIAFSPNENFFATGSKDGKVRVWETNSWNLKYTLSGHTKDVNSIAFSTDSKTLVSGGGDKTIRLWDVENGSLLKTIKAHEEESNLEDTSGVTSVNFSKDGNFLVSSGFDGCIFIWNITDDWKAFKITKQKGVVISAIFSPDDKYILSISSEGGIKFWVNKRTYQSESFRSFFDQKKFSSLTFSPNGTRFAGASGDKEIRIWDTKSWDEIKSLADHENIVSSIFFLNDYQLLSGSYDQKIKLWNIEDGSSRKLAELDKKVTAVKTSVNGAFLAIGGEKVEIWSKFTN
jgi:WD40 repeat protein/predicted patatin/cPLA2 family phospholipase